MAGAAWRGGRWRRPLAVAVVGVAGADIAALVMVPATPSLAAIQSTVTSAARRTVSAGTARISMDIAIRVQGPRPLSIDEQMTGVTDFVTHQIDMAVIAGPAAGTELRSVDGVAYEKLPASLRGSTRFTTPWVSFAVPLGAPGAAPGTGAAQDPAATINQLERLSAGAITGATESGQQTIRGVATTEYDLTVNVAAVQSIGQSFTANMGLPALGMSVKSVALSVWVDALGRVRRQRDDTRARMTSPLVPPGTTVRATVTLDTYDFGLPVEVTPPPSSQVTPVSNLGSPLNG